MKAREKGSPAYGLVTHPGRVADQLPAGYAVIESGQFLL
jgi:hypothetical protein